MKLNAQVPPHLDPNWELVSSKSDEFNSSGLNPALWDKAYSGCGWGWGFGSNLDSSNVIMENGYLKLRLNKSDSIISVGQIRSKNSDYNYGYFEISAKILDPGNYKNGIPCATGVWPSFWTYWVDYARYKCYHDEIDIVETLYDKCEDVHIMSGGVHDKIPESLDTCASGCQGVKVFSVEHKHSNPLFEAEHKYAAEWLRDRVILYFDDQPVGAYFGDGVPKHLQYVVLSMQVNNKWIDFDETIKMPQDMKVDYFRYYKLIDRYCEKDAHIKNNSQLNRFKFGTRRNIAIGTGTGSISLSAGDVKTFRASNEITVNGDFSVPLGAELNLIPTRSQ
ncbi:MAG: hypothetical protein A2W90_05225 [Bacteroidetes bacterium GWF2_42_66]|nr:MAG: hypothetical protein A2W92_03400 [Bacteroidetes bacterium GWA2_42_15]OFX95982.1 MAG: hypothetical protein A2W89_02635 [Bacteroidetes bacterium GWE2_42_39]OFY46555.1 MAG: hypothetical protein A2W90_05225 [Bacteroidetes bacterium GWF2_42_66]